MFNQISKILIISFFAGVLFLFETGAFANAPSVSASLSKRTASVGEEINLTLRVVGGSNNVQAPRLPAMDGFEIYYTGRASHITFINNVSTSKVEFSYILIPNKPGNFQLSPISMPVGGQVLSTMPLSIEVLARVAQPRQPQTQRSQPPASSPSFPQRQSASRTSSGPVVDQGPLNFQPADENIFIKASVDRQMVFPNQQVLLTYSLYTRYDTRYEGFSEEPEMSGFWIEEFPMGRDIRRETVRINGKRYIKADIRKIALFPTAAADYTIKPGSIKVSVRQEPQAESIFDEFFNDSFFSGSGFFSRREDRVLQPPPVQIKVIPFPTQGKPQKFQDAVGNFRLTSTIDKTEVKQNEPVTMKLTLEGEGNIETLKQPELPEIEGFKIYEADTSSQLFKTGNVIGGRKTFEIVFIPTTHGKQSIPKLKFDYFNPVSQQYQSLMTPEYRLKVLKSDKPFEVPKALSQQVLFKKDVEVESKDIRFINEESPSLAGGTLTSILFHFFIVLDGLLVLLVIWGLWRHRSEKIFSSNVGLKRFKHAKAQAASSIRSLGSLKKSSKPEDTREYFQEVDKILTQYLSDKFNLSTLGTTRSDIEQKLRDVLEHGDPLYESIMEVYRICDESRFGMQDLPHSIKEDASKILKQTIARVEKMRK